MIWAICVRIIVLPAAVQRLLGAWKICAGVLAALGVVCAGYSVQAAYRAIVAHQARAVAPVPTLHGFEAQDHFPGAALFYARDARPTLSAPERYAAPATGSTGTAELPALPIPATWSPGPMADGTVHPATPFSLHGASAADQARALECLATALYYEAASEPDAGQRAVAQVILNRVRHPAFPHSVCGVVYQGSQRASGCQFSFACDGAMARAPSASGWSRAARNAVLMLGGYVERSVGMATHYHTYAVTPAWNRSLVMTAAIGAHFFHRWQGYWGTPAAFSARYFGNEPAPGPLKPAATATMPGSAPLAADHSSVAPALPLASVAAAPGLVAPWRQVQPRYADSGAALAPPLRERAPGQASAVLPQSQILDRWKDSGKALR